MKLICLGCCFMSSVFRLRQSTQPLHKVAVLHHFFVAQAKGCDAVLRIMDFPVFLVGTALDHKQCLICPTQEEFTGTIVMDWMIVGGDVDGE